jgi:hypothetical protein
VTCIGGLQSRHDLAGGEYLDLKPVVGRFGDRLRECLGPAEQRIESSRKARGQSPSQFRHGLRDGGSRYRRPDDADASCLQELTTFHDIPPLSGGRLSTCMEHRP